MGNTCKSMADSCQCMAKTTTVLLSNKPLTNKNKWKKEREYGTVKLEWNRNPLVSMSFFSMYTNYFND